MSTSRRTRDQHVKKARKLVPDARIIGYALGRSGPNPVLVVLGVLGLFAVLAVVLLAVTSFAFYPGLLVIAGLQHLLSPPRGLVVCDRGVAVTGRSLLNGNPTKVLTLTAFDAVQPARRDLGRVEVLVAGEPLWLTEAEFAELGRGLAEARAATAPGPHPYPSHA